MGDNEEGDEPDWKSISSTSSLDSDKPFDNELMIVEKEKEIALLNSKLKEIDNNVIEKKLGNNNNNNNNNKDEVLEAADNIIDKKKHKDNKEDKDIIIKDNKVDKEEDFIIVTPNTSPKSDEISIMKFISSNKDDTNKKDIIVNKDTNIFIDNVSINLDKDKNSILNNKTNNFINIEKENSNASLLLFNEVQVEDKEDEEVIIINNKIDNKTIVNKKLEDDKISTIKIDNSKIVDNDNTNDYMEMETWVDMGSPIKLPPRSLVINKLPIVGKAKPVVSNDISSNNNNNNKIYINNNINNKLIDNISKLINKDHLPIPIDIGSSNRKVSMDGRNNSIDERNQSHNASLSKEKRFNSNDTSGSENSYGNQYIIDDEEYDSDYDKYMNHRLYKQKLHSSSLKSPSIYERKKSKNNLNNTESKSRQNSVSSQKSQNRNKSTNDADLLNTKFKSIDRVNSKAFDKTKYRNNKIFDPADPDLLISKLYQLNPRRFNPLGSSSSFFTISHIGLVFFLSLVVIYIQQQWGSYYRAAGAISCFFFSPSSNIDYMNRNISTSSNLYNDSGVDINECTPSACYKPLVPSYSDDLNLNSCKISKKNQTIFAINNAINNYFQIPIQSMAQFEIPTSTNICKLHNEDNTPRIEVTYIDAKIKKFPLSNDINYQDNNLVPLIFQDLYTISNIKLIFPLVDKLAFDIYKGVYLWNFNINYLLLDQIQFVVTHNQEIIGVCDGGQEDDAAKFISTNTLFSAFINLNENASYSASYTIYVLQVICILFCCFVLIFQIFEFSDNYNFYLVVKEQLGGYNTYDANNNRIDENGDIIPNEADIGDEENEQEADPNMYAPSILYGMNKKRRKIPLWKDLSFTTKLHLLDSWRLMLLLGVSLCFIYCCQCLFTDGGYLFSTSSRYLLGASIFTLYVSLLGYLRYNRTFKILSLVFVGSYSQFFPVIIGTAPMMCGFLVVGIVIFGESSSLFADPAQTLMTLFSFMNGDSMYDIINTTTAYGAIQYFDWLGSIYLLLFALIFSGLFLRVLLASIELVFFAIERLYWKSISKRKYFREKLIQQKLKKIKIEKRKENRMKKIALSKYSFKSTDDVYTLNTPSNSFGSFNAFLKSLSTNSLTEDDGNQPELLQAFTTQYDDNSNDDDDDYEDDHSHRDSIEKEIEHENEFKMLDQAAKEEMYADLNYLNNETLFSKLKH